LGYDIGERSRRVAGFRGFVFTRVRCGGKAAFDEWLPILYAFPGAEIEIHQEFHVPGRTKER
jgi:hypothetical protein